MKARVITARIDENLNFEIEFLKSSLGLTSTTSVLSHAIHTLYSMTKEKQSKKSSLEMFEEKGLMGCMEGNPKLSVNYKNEMTSVISKKHSKPELSAKKSAIRQ